MRKKVVRVGQLPAINHVYAKAIHGYKGSKGIKAAASACQECGGPIKLILSVATFLFWCQAALKGLLAVTFAW